MYCFYHSADLDGYASAAIVKSKYKDAILRGIDYGKDFPLNEINKNDSVMMVDFSIQPFVKMVELQSHCNLVWIDHHKSAIENYRKFVNENPNFSISGLLGIGAGACQLVWEYLYPYCKIPYWVKLLSNYDVWDHSDPNTLFFQYGMRVKDVHPESENWYLKDLDAVDLETEFIIKDGKLILDYQKRQDEIYVKSYGFETTLLRGNLDYGVKSEYKAIAVNKGMTNSKIFDSVWDSNKYDVMVTFCKLPETPLWTVSIYSDKNNVDCSLIASSHCGGGYKGAAGFQCTSLPFLGRSRISNS